MGCQHTDRQNVLSLPSMGNPHMCRECWDTNVQPKFDALPRSGDYKAAWESQSDYAYRGDALYFAGKLAENPK